MNAKKKEKIKKSILQIFLLPFFTGKGCEINWI